MANENEVLTIENDVVVSCAKDAVKVTVPMSIGKEAFKDCVNLVSVEMYPSVKEIGEGAFSGCTNLKELSFSGMKEEWRSVRKHDGWNKDLTMPFVQCFMGKSLVRKPNDDETVPTVENGAVISCDKEAVNVVIPEGVTKIGEKAFFRCPHLWSLAIPGSVSEIGEWAFAGNSLTEITFGGTISQWENVRGKTKILSYGLSKSVRCSDGEWKVPDVLTEGGMILNAIDKQISVINIPSDITEIESFAFQYCNWLSEITFGGTIEQWENVKNKRELLRYVPATGVKCSDGEWKKETILVENGVATVCFDNTLESVVVPDGVTELDNWLFCKFKTLKNVVLPPTLKKIGDRAFGGCQSLESIELPDGLTEICESAFSNCQNLKSLTIPKSVTKIGARAFDGCRSLESLVIPDGVSEISASTFFGCDSLKSVSIGKSVETIGESAFEYCKIKSVVIPDSVTEIGEKAFFKCEPLESVSIGNGVKKIGKEAFACTALKSAEIPDSVTEIEYNAFTHCKSLESLSIGKSVETIGVAAFEDCKMKSVVIPDSVKKIENSAFEDCKSLESLVIGNGVTEIGDRAFRFNPSLKSIKIGSGLQKIGEYVFMGCRSVLEIESSAALFPYSERARKLYDATGKSRKAILVLNALKEKAKKEKIEQLQNVSATAVLDSIVGGHKAKCAVVRDKRNAYLRIKGKNGGTEIVLPDSKVTTWMQKLPALLDFAENCADSATLRKYVIDNDFKDACMKYINVGKTNRTALPKRGAKPAFLVIPDGVTTIPEEGFKSLDSLESLFLPSSVTEIGGKAFRGCESLSEIEFGGTIEQWENVKKTRSWNYEINTGKVKCSDGEWTMPELDIENGVVIKCRDKKATSITIPDGVTKIGKKAFDHCESLESVVIPEGVTEIECEAFNFCSSLKSVSLPPSVTKIGEEAFYLCESLKSVVIPPSLTKIEQAAFIFCRSLESVVIPPSVVEIGSGAFKYCSSLSSIEIPPSVRKIGSGAFGYAGLKSVTIPGSVTIVGNGAFCQNTSLESVVINDGVTELEEYLFRHCSSLKSVSLPSSLTTINWWVFNYCDSLREITFRGTLKQWKAVKKKERDICPLVKCTDGEAKL